MLLLKIPNGIYVVTKIEFALSKNFTSWYVS